MNKFPFDNTTRVLNALKNAPLAAYQHICGGPRLARAWIRDFSPMRLHQFLLSAHWDHCALPEETDTEFFKTRLAISPGVIDTNSLPPDTLITIRRRDVGGKEHFFAECPRALVKDEEFTVIGLYWQGRYGEQVDGDLRTLTSTNPFTRCRMARKRIDRQCTAEEAWNLGLVLTAASA